MTKFISILLKNFSSSTRSEKYTVLINTWKREDFLRQSVPHYAKCKHIDAIRIVWSESLSPPGSLVKDLAEEVKRHTNASLLFDIHKDQTLNCRFKPLPGIRTNGVFSVDDDIIIPCSSMDVAFRLWQSSRDAMVGFMPRIHVKTNEVYSYQFLNSACFDPHWFCLIGKFG